ncbi:GNAT family N-acetyltransferase [Salipaludibacillus sp. HK11]|uniref:GNAT family N-acetyltransferase n=1 Tax=Salipaludibacillus sp. HK11 TaxID=3394320 RepID=UPI0039FD19F8
MSFEKIHILGDTVAETDLYKQHHFPEMLVMYDSNYIQFKRLPSLKEFIEAETYLQNFHARYEQNHVKFYFPENEKLTEELDNYLNKTGYDIGFMELYSIQASEFPEIKHHRDIEVEVVTEKNIDEFLTINYQQSLDFGKKFAKQKRKLIQRQFNDPSYLQLLAYYKGIPAGVVHVIVSDETAEIDNLTVEESFQKNGVGSALQKKVMDTFPNKTIILIADGEDTARNMYKKQNYQYWGYRFEALETF